MSTYASNVLQTLGSYTPIFIFASLAYLMALLVVHLIVPRHAPVQNWDADSPLTLAPEI